MSGASNELVMGHQEEGVNEEREREIRGFRRMMMKIVDGVLHVREGWTTA